MTRSLLRAQERGRQMLQAAGLSNMRNLLCVAASFIAALLALGPPARAQDLIRYLDRKAMKEASVSGTIQEENPSTVAYKPLSLAGTKEIPALDISDVVYDVPIAVKLIYRNAQSEESKAPPPAAKDGDRSSAQADALRNYQEVLAKLDPKKYKFAERHIQFKIARLLARLAEESPEQADAAIEGLSSFVKKYPDGWQISPAAKLLARLQMSKGDAEGARKTYETLAATDNIPRQVQQDCEFQIADALISGKKFADAQKKLQGLMKGFSTDDP